MTDHLAEARAAIHAEHGWSMAAPASSLADMAYAIAHILDHLEEQRVDPQQLAASIRRGLDDAAAGRTEYLGRFADEPEPDPLDESNHADRYDRDGDRWVWCGECDGLRLGAQHCTHASGYGWSAYWVNEDYGPLTFAPRPADTPAAAPQPDEAHGDAPESTKSWTAICGGGEIVSSAGFSHWLDNIRAEAWGEGFDVGATHGIAYQAGDDNALPQPSTLNPYRKDRA